MVVSVTFLIGCKDTNDGPIEDPIYYRYDIYVRFESENGYNLTDEICACLHPQLCAERHFSYVQRDYADIVGYKVGFSRSLYLYKDDVGARMDFWSSSLSRDIDSVRFEISCKPVFRDQSIHEVVAYFAKSGDNDIMRRCVLDYPYFDYPPLSDSSCGEDESVSLSLNPTRITLAPTYTKHYDKRALGVRIDGGKFFTADTFNLVTVRHPLN